MVRSRFRRSRKAEPMPFNFDPGDLEGEYFSEFLPQRITILHEVNEPSHCKGCHLAGCRGCRGLKSNLKDSQENHAISKTLKMTISPPTPLTPHEQRFFDLTGDLPGDAWEGELPDDHSPDVGKMVIDLFDDVQKCRSIPWPEVMQGAAEDRQFGRKTTLALMLPHHEGKFEWYEHPITKKWHSYAAFPQ